MDGHSSDERQADRPTICPPFSAVQTLPLWSFLVGNIHLFSDEMHTAMGQSISALSFALCFSQFLPPPPAFLPSVICPFVIFLGNCLWEKYYETITKAIPRQQQQVGGWKWENEWQKWHGKGGGKGAFVGGAMAVPEANVRFSLQTATVSFFRDEQ
ncbi:hypothetical protein niasHT_007381 [Heterodera trifolii]|uniref:Uncharacterized protein n=1 Tax=Heterodera trifolii TaxID=157864 RepID=A0ABD2LLV8_9BILA